MNLKYLLLSLLTTGLIAFVSSLPNHSLPGDGSLADQILSNLAHIPAYALLTFLWLKTFDRRKNKTQLHKFSASQFPGFTKSQPHNFAPSRLPVPLNCSSSVLAGLVLFAVSDEIHQSFIPGRTASCTDVGLDVLGICLGLAIFKIFKAFNISREISTLKQKSLTSQSLRQDQQDEQDDIFCTPYTPKPNAWQSTY
ncbi:MAG: VanZ family protein [Desulfobacterales bacterium]|nr:VanZ family protein [Desulfobacterales bacterium]